VVDVLVAEGGATVAATADAAATVTGAGVVTAGAVEIAIEDLNS
jgi:hypothetical protein